MTGTLVLGVKKHSAATEKTMQDAHNQATVHRCWKGAILLTRRPKVICRLSVLRVLVSDFFDIMQDIGYQVPLCFGQQLFLEPFLSRRFSIFALHIYKQLLQSGKVLSATGEVSNAPPSITSSYPSGYARVIQNKLDRI